MATWREHLVADLGANKECWDDVEHSTLTDDELDVEFDDGYGGSRGKNFTLWTENRVYFPVVYDGAEWTGSVPRNPCNEASGHHGGE